MKYIKIMPLVGFLLSAPVAAQVVYKAKGSDHSQLIVERDGDGFKTCGVRLILTEKRSNDFDLIDVAIMAMMNNRGEVGFIQGSKTTFTHAEALSRSKAKAPSGPAPEAFWIAKSTDTKPLVPISINQSSPGTFVGATHLEPAVAQIINIAGGEAMHMMLRLPRQRERIVETSLPLSQSDLQTLFVCLKDLTTRAWARQDERKKSFE